MEGRPRRTRPIFDPDTENNAETVTAFGLYFLEHMEQARDRNGNGDLVAREFLHLPDRNRYPDYYEKVPSPLAFDTVRFKLEHGQYPNLGAFDVDVKHVLGNARIYYKKNDPIYIDAERVRKMFSDFARKSFVPKAKQLAASTPTGRGYSGPAPPGSGRYRVKRKLRPEYEEIEQQRQNKKRRTNSDSAFDAIPPPLKKEAPIENKSYEDSISSWPGHIATDFKGMDMGAAQLQIIDDCKKLETKEGENFTQVFHDRPSRSLVDYYQTIKYAVSLNSIRKKVIGFESKGQSTGITEFKYWEDFEKEISFIWTNAQTYNEDDSHFYRYSQMLEDFFKRRVAQAKVFVHDPARTNLKLKMSKTRPAQSSKIRLSYPGSSQSPTNEDNSEEKYLRRSTRTPSATQNGEQTHATRLALGISESYQQTPTQGIRSHGPTQSLMDPLASNLPTNDQVHASPFQLLNRPPSAAAQTLMGPPAPRFVLPAPLEPSDTDAAGRIYGPDSPMRRPSRDISQALIKNTTYETRRGRTGPSTRSDFPASGSFTQQNHTVIAYDMVRVRLTLGLDMQTRQSNVVCMFNGRVHPHDKAEIMESNHLERRTFSVDTRAGGVLEFHAIAAQVKGTPKSNSPRDTDHESICLVMIKDTRI